MQLRLQKAKLPNPDLVIRRCGYALFIDPRTHVKSFVRRFNRDGFFPRFHLYIEDEGENWSFNLHLDQRAPMYKGVTAHGGEYDGEVVEREFERIKSLLPSN